MLTPKFEIDQDADFLIIRIHAPHIKVSSVETYIDGNTFQFHCHPYFLSLHLPCPLTEDGRERACYDVDTGAFVVYAPKLTQGEEFPDLDMVTKLLTQPKKMPDIRQITGSPGISVIGESSPALHTQGGASGDEIGDIDWTLEQTLPAPVDVVALTGPCYGFADQRQGVFSRLQEDLPELVALPLPDKTPPSQRGALRISCEDSEFDPEHYLADTMDISHLEPVLAYSPSWQPLCEKDRSLLTQLPKKEYLIGSPMESQLLHGLIDITFAYCYASRSTEGEMDVESAWTIWKLSSTLSWLQIFCSLRETLVSSLRRSLIYPIYRNFQLSVRVLSDTCSVFAGGKPLILKCLLHTYQLFSQSDLHYIHNDLYIKDYCVWIQSVSSKKLAKVCEQLGGCAVAKQELGLELVELEMAALITLEEEMRGEEIISGADKKLDKLILTDESDEETGKD